MPESILRPDNASSVPGGTAAADTVVGKTTPGAGQADQAPITNDTMPGNPSHTDPGMTGQTPSGGNKAVPDDNTLMHSQNTGDSSGFGDGGGTSVDADAPYDPDQDQPTISETDDTDDETLPTGGLTSGTSPR